MTCTSFASTLRTPRDVLMTIGETVSRNVIAITALAPSPNISVKIGYSAMIGAEYWSHTSGSTARLTRRYQPIASPSGRPTSVASASPAMSSAKLARTFFHSSPAVAWSHSADATRRRARDQERVDEAELDDRLPEAEDHGERERSEQQRPQSHSGALQLSNRRSKRASARLTT